MRAEGAARIALLAACLGAGACVKQIPLRGSSYEHMSDSEARVVLPAREEAVMDALSSLLAERGFTRIDKREISRDLTYYMYSGRRRSVQDLRGSVVNGTGYLVSEGHEFGSWFVARVIGGRPTTEVLLIGKPTIDGHAICADADKILAEAQYWCLDTKVRNDYAGARELHGTAEADTVRGVLSTLKERFGVR